MYLHRSVILISVLIPVRRKGKFPCPEEIMIMIISFSPLPSLSLSHQSDNEDLNKTLPKNFRFPANCHTHQSSHGNLLSPNSTMQSPPNRISPVRSMGSSTRYRSTSIQRRAPVSSKPNLSRYARNNDKEGLGKSDPAIGRHVSDGH